METNLIVNGKVDEKYYWPTLYIPNIISIQRIKRVCNVSNTVPKKFTSYM